MMSFTREGERRITMNMELISHRSSGRRSRHLYTVAILALSLAIFASLEAGIACAERRPSPERDRAAQAEGKKGTASETPLQQSKGQRVTAPWNQSRVAAPSRWVVINGTRLSDDFLFALERQYRVHIQDGAYWYDRVSG